MGRVLHPQSRHLDRCFRVAPAPASELLRALFTVIFKRRSRVTTRPLHSYTLSFSSPLLFSSRLPWMKSCRAAVISLANFSGSEDQNNPGCRRSTGMNRASVHTRRIGGIGRGFGTQGKTRSLAAGYKMRNELHRYTTEYAKRLLHFSLHHSFFFSSFFLFLLRRAAPRRDAAP